MPHLTIRVEDGSIDIAAVAQTQAKAAGLVADRFGIPADFVACGVAAQEAFGHNRKTIEVTLAAACDSEGKRKKAGDSVADDLCAFYVGWLREQGRTGSVSVSIQFVETNPYREGRGLNTETGCSSHCPFAPGSQCQKSRACVISSRSSV